MPGSLTGLSSSRGESNPTSRAPKKSASSCASPPATSPQPSATCPAILTRLTQFVEQIHELITKQASFKLQPSLSPWGDSRALPKSPALLRSLPSPLISFSPGSLAHRRLRFSAELANWLIDPSLVTFLGSLGIGQLAHCRLLLCRSSHSIPHPSDLGSLANWKLAHLGLCAILSPPGTPPLDF